MAAVFSMEPAPFRHMRALEPIPDGAVAAMANGNAAEVLVRARTMDAG